VKNIKLEKFARFWVLPLLILIPFGAAFGQEAGKAPEKQEQAAPKTKLDDLRAEWEAVREQQIQMIREKEDQLEKLKEEIFAKMKVLNAPVAPQPAASQPEVSKAPAANSSELEAQRAALQAERQKFFNEMNRQKESLRQLQSSLDKKAKELQAERESFEQAKKATGR
jgi:flagellar motility protein MotE (MotC chaperone)